jgi:hypothetical protein
MASSDPLKTRESRITEDYLVAQIDGFRGQDSHTNHKTRIESYDQLYWGNFSKLFPGESGLSGQPLVENKLKNATHDLARLASEAKGSPVFMKEGEGKTKQQRAAIRASIASTIWTMGRGEDMLGMLYIDLIVAGYAAMSVYFSKGDEYPQFLRLDPRFCYPDVMNGQLQQMLYVETMLERQAAMKWPELGLNGNASNTNSILLVQSFDEHETIMAVCTTKRNGKADKAHIVQRWEHDLGCVPVAFVRLDSADSSYHGLMDQIGGPMMIRNKIVRLLADYLESMAHAPFESKNILDDDQEPGHDTIYHHDPNADESFIRRVAPASPAGAVFGVLQYMDAQESAEAIQPPARVGVVSQSIASGSFVASTQGTLSSVVKDLQKKMATLRYMADYIAFKIDEKYLDREKPLFNAVGNKNTYTPSKDMKGFFYHTIQYGASAGLNQAEADQRVQAHLAAGLISHETGRAQLDYIEDLTVEQDRIDREALANAFFQRFAGDPRTPQSVIAKAVRLMNEGKSFMEVIEEVEPDLFAAEQQAATAGEQPGGAVAGQQPGSTGEPATGGQGFQQEAPQFAPPIFGQSITRNLG